MGPVTTVKILGKLRWNCEFWGKLCG